MKKNVFMLFAFVLCVFFIIPGCQVTSKDNNKFNNVTDYSSNQEEKGWTYLFGAVNFQPTLMTYYEYLGSYSSQYASVTKSEWKPHQNEDIILRYESQMKDDATIKYKVNLIGIQREDDDGVLFSVFGNDVNKPLTEISLVGNGEYSVATGELSINLKKGDFLYFVLNSGYGSENDLTNVELTISY